jgi:hypothetical protein
LRQEIDSSSTLGINDLTDGKTGGHSVFLGEGAGVSDDGSLIPSRFVS